LLKKGRSVLIKVEDSPGAGTYTTIGGLRVSSISWDNEPVDITNKDSSGIRDLLEGAGTRSVSITGSGVFTDGAAYNVMRTAARNGTHLNYQFLTPGDTYADTAQGAFMVTKLEEAGEYNGEMTYSVSMESDGAVSIVA
jgi:phage major tail protein, TP901-1 family